MSKFETIDEYTQALDGWKLEAARKLDQLVLEVAPEAQRVMKWKQPTYEDHGLLCYFVAFKNHINFGFFRGTEIEDPNGLLEGSGDKMRHVKIKSTDDINDALKQLIAFALELNRNNNS
ncbi:DUF1801 domain-containing protein [Dethiobacter alkaliphilus]|uniref:DUF1801 domain-containing protein n=1 Tax=Dethiobacter alkaliphilus TaxID=427926 RepID=UPI002225CAE5|nr:DUF1801 domain-containing protein [Dethiobacter alkaliphilus]MCW3489727.1 DUF1801 domain-containing protein [Dethiobacter alkaliphilus]